MNASTNISSASKKARWIGRVVSALPVLFLLMDSTLKFIKPPVVVETMNRIGYHESIILPLGIILLISTLLYVIPQTGLLGAIILTGYLGGAVASHARIGDPLFTHVLFPVYLGVLLWLGIFLREGRLRVLVPLRTNA